MSQNLGKTSLFPKFFWLVCLCQSLLMNKFLCTYKQLKIREYNAWLSWKYILKYVAIKALLPKKGLQPQDKSIGGGGR